MLASSAIIDILLEYLKVSKSQKQTLSSHLNQI